MTEQDDNEPGWLRKLKRSAFAIVCAFAGALFINLTTIFEAMTKMYDHYCGVPEAFELADRSAKSTFSDQLSQRAWRRLFWATNFNLRVQNVAPLADIDSYVDADADWNANIMIAILGLERFYDVKRSDVLEREIQSLFSKLDDELAQLRNSDVVKALRDGRKPTDKELDATKEISKRAKSAQDEVNYALYELVRCIPAPVSSPISRKICVAS
jgi:hypothetical protein